jgi:predicted dehydrogenase
VYDWGSHYIDWILQLFGKPVVAVRAQEAKRVWHDVTNADHVTVDIRFEDGGAASFVHSDIAAAVKPKWYVLGTKGAAVGDWRYVTRRRRGPDGELDEEPVPPTDLPARVSVLRPDGGGGVDRETLALPKRDRSAFYRNLAAHLTHGEPLAVSPQEARRVVAVMEAATESAARGGALVERRI